MNKHVYVIKNEFGGVKVGVSSNLKERFDKIKNTGGFRITRIWFSEICSNHFEIEKIIHERFSNYRTIGEWFNIEFDDVVEFAMTQNYGSPINLNISKEETEHEQIKDIDTKELRRDVNEHCYNAMAFGNLLNGNLKAISKSRNILISKKSLNCFRYFDPITQRMIYCKLSPMSAVAALLNYSIWLLFKLNVILKIKYYCKTFYWINDNG